VNRKESTIIFQFKQVSTSSLFGNSQPAQASPSYSLFGHQVAKKPQLFNNHPQAQFSPTFKQLHSNTLFSNYQDPELNFLQKKSTLLSNWQNQKKIIIKYIA
jgi:hypothetical protein